MFAAGRRLITVRVVGPSTSMTATRVAIIGTGPDPDNPTVDSFAMGYEHADAYRAISETELVACADLVRENAEAFAELYGLDEDAIYESYDRMLEEVEPDMVSVCVPPAVHADVVVGCIRSGVVDAVHCEKPMALRWDGARLMTQEADRRDVNLTFNHQRRFGAPFRDAKAALDEGVIGDLQRVEYTWGNFFDNGTHAIDMCNYFNDERPAEWVIAQLDYREEDVRFGTHNENQMFAQWRYDNGVYGVASTGAGAELTGGDWRLEGTAGTIEVSLVDELAVEVLSKDGETSRTEYDRDGNWIQEAIADAVEAVGSDERSELCARNALNATEIIFAGYESARNCGRVDLPLSIDDNPLESMVESGALSPSTEE